MSNRRINFIEKIGKTQLQFLTQISSYEKQIKLLEQTEPNKSQELDNDLHHEKTKYKQEDFNKRKSSSFQLQIKEEIK